MRLRVRLRRARAGERGFSAYFSHAEDDYCACQTRHHNAECSERHHATGDNTYRIGAYSYWYYCSMDCDDCEDYRNGDCSDDCLERSR